MDDTTKPDWLALKQKIPVKKAAALNDMSEDSFRRHYSHRNCPPAERRCPMRSPRWHSQTRMSWIPATACLSMDRRRLGAWRVNDQPIGKRRLPNV